MEVFAAVVVLIGVYFVPSVIASARRHSNFGAILALNFFLGWTFLGWVAAFVWSCSNSGYHPAGVTYLSSEGAPAQVDREADFQARIGRIILWIIGGAVVGVAYSLLR
jgi:Superinfection immunity protein